MRVKADTRPRSGLSWRVGCCDRAPSLPPGQLLVRKCPGPWRVLTRYNLSAPPGHH